MPDIDEIARLTHDRAVLGNTENVATVKIPDCIQRAMIKGRYHPVEMPLDIKREPLALKMFTDLWDRALPQWDYLIHAVYRMCTETPEPWFVGKYPWLHHKHDAKPEPRPHRRPVWWRMDRAIGKSWSNPTIVEADFDGIGQIRALSSKHQSTRACDVFEKIWNQTRPALTWGGIPIHYPYNVSEMVAGDPCNK